MRATMVTIIFAGGPAVDRRPAPAACSTIRRHRPTGRSAAVATVCFAFTVAAASASLCVDRDVCRNPDRTGDASWACAEATYPVRFDLPLTFYNTAMGGGGPDQDCCYDSDLDGTLDTNFNPGGIQQLADGNTAPFAGWPQSRAHEWGNCTEPCWAIVGVECKADPGVGCGSPALARPICPDPVVSCGDTVSGTGTGGHYRRLDVAVPGATVTIDGCGGNTSGLSLSILGPGSQPVQPYPTGGVEPYAGTLLPAATRRLGLAMQMVPNTRGMLDSTRYAGDVAELPLASPVLIDQLDLVDLDTNGDNMDFFSVMAIGYFMPPVTDSYTFALDGNDMYGLWIGDLAVAAEGRTVNNVLVGDLIGGARGVQTSAPVYLVAGLLYPMRIVWQENLFQGYLRMYWGRQGASEPSVNLAEHFYTFGDGSDFLRPCGGGDGASLTRWLQPGSYRLAARMTNQMQYELNCESPRSALACGETVAFSASTTSVPFSIDSADGQWLAFDGCNTSADVVLWAHHRDTMAVVADPTGEGCGQASGAMLIKWFAPGDYVLVIDASAEGRLTARCGDRWSGRTLGCNETVSDTITTDAGTHTFDILISSSGHWQTTICSAESRGVTASIRHSNQTSSVTAVRQWAGTCGDGMTETVILAALDAGSYALVVAIQTDALQTEDGHDSAIWYSVTTGCIDRQPIQCDQRFQGNANFGLDIVGQAASEQTFLFTVAAPGALVSFEACHPAASLYILDGIDVSLMVGVSPVVERSIALKAAAARGLMYERFSGDRTATLASGDLEGFVRPTVITALVTEDVEDGDSVDYYVENIVGYFQPPVTEHYTFSIDADEYYGFWLGDIAAMPDGRTASNALLGVFPPTVGAARDALQLQSSVPVLLLAGMLYPIRIVFQELTATGHLRFYWRSESSSISSSLGEHFYHSPNPVDPFPNYNVENTTCGSSVSAGSVLTRWFDAGDHVLAVEADSEFDFRLDCDANWNRGAISCGETAIDTLNFGQHRYTFAVGTSGGDEWVTFDACGSSFVSRSTTLTVINANDFSAVVSRTGSLCGGGAVLSHRFQPGQYMLLIGDGGDGIVGERGSYSVTMRCGAYWSYGTVDCGAVLSGDVHAGQDPPHNAYIRTSTRAANYRLDLDPASGGCIEVRDAAGPVGCSAAIGCMESTPGCNRNMVLQAATDYLFTITGLSTSNDTQYVLNVTCDTVAPTVSPTTLPSSTPTTAEPTASPSIQPTSSTPTSGPSAMPTESIPTSSPSRHPTADPSMLPTSANPTLTPSMLPTTASPTVSPSAAPTTSTPTSSPTLVPTALPTASPTPFSCVAGETEIVQVPGMPRRCRFVNTSIGHELVLESTVIQPSNGEGMLFFPFRVSPLPAGAATDTYSSAGSISAFAAGGRVRVTAGQVSSQAGGFSATRPGAYNLIETPIFTANEVYEGGEDRPVKMYVQLRSSAGWSTRGPSRSVKVIYGPTSSDGTHVGSLEVTQVCGGLGSDGICEVVLPVPPAWTTATGVAGEVLRIPLSVLYGFADESTAGFAAVPNAFTAQRTLPFPNGIDDDDTNALYMGLPARNMLPGETFTVDIRSRHLRDINTFEVRLDVGSGLEIVSGSYASGAFVGTPRIADPVRRSRLIADTYRLSRPAATNASAPTDELLLTVIIRATVVFPNSSQPDRNPAQVTLLATRITDGQDNLLRSAILVRDRAGVSVSSSGHVNLLGNRQMGFFAYVRNGVTQLVNLAVLSITAPRDSAEIAAKVVTEHGIIAASEQLACQRSSANPGIGAFALTADCRVTLEGTEIIGVEHANVIVAFAGNTRAVPLQVLFPFNVTLEAEQTTLRPISGWYDCETTGRRRRQVTSPPTLVASQATCEDTWNRCNVNPHCDEVFFSNQVTGVCRAT